MTDYNISGLPLQPVARKRSRRRNREQSSRSSSRHRQRDRIDTQEPIPRFSPGIRVVGQTGRIDATEIGFNYPHQRFDDLYEVAQFWKHLGGAKHEYVGTEDATMFSPLFCATSYNGDKSLPLKFRRKASRFDDPLKKMNGPLVAGQVQGLRGSGETISNNFAWCRIQDQNSLSLNLTRAVNHRRKELLAGEGWRNTLFRNDPGKFIRGIDGKSNLCPRDISHRDFRIASRRFFTNVFEGLSEEIRRAWLFANGSGTVSQGGVDLIQGQTDSFESVSVRKLETYWEFTTDNATALLDRLEPLLKSYWKTIKTTNHGFESGIENNERTIKIFKDSGTSIKLYAKEIGLDSDRLRIEIVHKPKASRKLVPRYSANSIEGFFSITDTLAEKAAEEVNSLFSYIEEWSTESPKERANSTKFLSRWFSEMGHGRRSLALLGLFRSSGRVISGNSLPSSLKAVLKKAEKRRLIFRQSTIYRPRKVLT